MTNKKRDVVSDELSQEDVWDILAFAENLSGGGFYGGSITPMLLNSRLKDISLSNISPSEQTLNEAMKDPKNSEIALMGFSEDFELQSQVYRKLLSYLSDLLAFDFNYVCTNAKFSDYKSPAYNKDLDVVKEFFDNFDYKKEFRTITRQMLRNEAFFGCPRFDAKKLVIQELPASPNYTMITGRFEYGLLFSFNLYWFLQPGVDIRLYPPFMADKFNKLFGGKELSSYNGSLSPELRGGSSWVYWQDIPTEVGFAFKFSQEIATRIPVFAPLFLDLIQQPLMRALQKNINMSVASRLIMGQVGTLKDAGAKLKDQFNINPDLLGKFLALVKSAVGDSLKVAAAPLDNLQPVSFISENDVYPAYLRNALASSGVNTSLIFTNSARPNIFESQASLNVDEQMMTALYPQFNAFLNYYINKRTKKFKFDFQFEGTNFFNNRQMRLDNALKLASQGIVLPQKIAASQGISPFNFQRQLEEARAMEFVDNLTPITRGFNSPLENKGGRPQKSEAELSDAGADTRGNGNNIERGGSI